MSAAPALLPFSPAWQSRELIGGVSSTRKKKLLSFAPSSFNISASQEVQSSVLIGDSNINQKVQNDVQFLYDQLQKVTRDRDELMARCELLQTQMFDIVSNNKELSTRRELEKKAFRETLKNEKLAFDKSRMFKTLKLKDRNNLLSAWVKAVMETGIDKEHKVVQELITRTLVLFTKPPTPKKPKTKKHLGKSKEQSKESKVLETFEYPNTHTDDHEDSDYLNGVYTAFTAYMEEGKDDDEEEEEEEEEGERRDGGGGGDEDDEGGMEEEDNDASDEEINDEWKNGSTRKHHPVHSSMGLESEIDGIDNDGEDSAVLSSMVDFNFYSTQASANSPTEAAREEYDKHGLIVTKEIDNINQLLKASRNSAVSPIAHGPPLSPYIPLYPRNISSSSSTRSSTFSPKERSTPISSKGSEEHDRSSGIDFESMGYLNYNRVVEGIVNNISQLSTDFEGVDEDLSFPVPFASSPHTPYTPHTPGAGYGPGSLPLVRKKH